MHPQTVYAHWIATLEIFVGMSGIALATGLIFARFSRPRAKIMFSRYAVVRPIDGHMTLMARAANGRQNVIAEAHGRMRMMRVETSAEGYTLRKLYDLTLVREQHPAFLFGWTLMHIIDETSPLFGETAESMKAREASLLISIEGADEETAQTMQARHTWEAEAFAGGTSTSTCCAKKKASAISTTSISTKSNRLNPWRRPSRPPRSTRGRCRARRVNKAPLGSMADLSQNRPNSRSTSLLCVSKPGN